MFILLTLVHILICFFLVIVVLLQSGKAADLAGAFGGMGSQTAFGPRGSATLLSKATTIAAALFMVTSLTLSILATRTTGGPSSSVLDRQTGRPARTAPAPATNRPAPPAQIPATPPAQQSQPQPPAPAPAQQQATPPAKK